MSHLGFFESGQLSFYEAKQIFMWSRIRTAKDHSQASLTCLRNMFFEDFMEGIVRLSMRVALPIDEEIQELGVDDAGEYLLSLAEQSPSLYRSFLRDRKGNWFGPPKQPIWRCADHLLNYITRLIEANSRGDRDLTVSHNEATQFARQRTKGAELMFADLPESDGSPKRKGKNFASGMRHVRERLVQSLKRVNQLAEWPDPKLRQLLDCMSESPYEADELVFHQDDPGDEFFIIISGKADVMRMDPVTRKVDVLITLEDGASFGERALLMAEPRYASVKAVTKLRTLCITRTGFEKNFGAFGQSFANEYAAPIPDEAGDELEPNVEPVNEATGDAGNDVEQVEEAVAASVTEAALPPDQPQAVSLS